MLAFDVCVARSMEAVFGMLYLSTVTVSVCTSKMRNSPDVL